MPPYFMSDRFINPCNGGNILQITIHRLIGLNHLKQRTFLPGTYNPEQQVSERFRNRYLNRFRLTVAELHPEVSEMIFGKLLKLELFRISYMQAAEAQKQKNSNVLCSL